MANNRNNPFRKQSRLNNVYNNVEKGHTGRRDRVTSDQQNDKEKEWGKVKFNPVAKTACASELATPWKTFKREIIQKHAKEGETALTGNTTENQFQKKFAENLRKHQILEKQKQPTRWEDFGKANDKMGDKYKNGKINKSNGNREQCLKNPSNLFISEDSLRNFDSKKLTFIQKNNLRKIITKTTCLASAEGSLTAIVGNLKNPRRRKNK